MSEQVGELLPPTRLMLTPGPSSMDPRVYRALATPLVGHLDPWFMEMMGDVQGLLRRVYRTENRVTFPISASGSGGIEAAVLNPLESGDEAIVCVNGWFSERMAHIAERTAARVIRVEAPYGRAVDPEDVRRAAKGRKIKLVGLAHGETSTGVAQRLDDFRKVADELGALLVVDAVATLAGLPLESGDEAIVCVNGWFSERMAHIAERTAARVIRVEAPYGRAVDPEDVRRAAKGRKIKLVGLAHGETSTGVAQRLDDFRKVADELGALLVVDAVATLAGLPVEVDRQRIDICFSGSQKAISAPPGMAPITVNAGVEEVLRARKSKVQSWYFDLTTTMNYWGKERTYHHTPPISLIYGLREALRLVLEEGLEARWERHRQNQQALVAGLEAMGLELFVSNPADRLITVSSVRVPEGVDDVRVRRQLLDEFNIEIAGGFGPLKGQVWRVGLMGYSCQRGNVLLFLAALEKVLLEQGFKVPAGAGVGAAVRASLAAPESVTIGNRK